MNNNFKIEIANKNHIIYINDICKAIEQTSKTKGTGIAKREPDYIKEKILQNKAVIALTTENVFCGFCYIETFSNDNYVANSGLIVVEKYRNQGIAKKIKKEIFNLSTIKYPNAKIFGLSTELAVMKINSELGYNPVTYSELTHDYTFWKGCESCSNYDILVNKRHENCLCTAMLYKKSNEKEEVELNLYERLIRLKKFVFLKNK